MGQPFIWDISHGHLGKRPPHHQHQHQHATLRATFNSLFVPDLSPQTSVALCVGTILDPGLGTPLGGTYWASYQTHLHQSSFLVMRRILMIFQDDQVHHHQDDQDDQQPNLRARDPAALPLLLSPQLNVAGGGVTMMMMGIMIKGWSYQVVVLMILSSQQSICLALERDITIFCAKTSYTTIVIIDYKFSRACPALGRDTPSKEKVRLMLLHQPCQVMFKNLKFSIKKSFFYVHDLSGDIWGSPQNSQ